MSTIQATTVSTSASPRRLLHRLYALIFPFTRKRRMRRFESLMYPTAETRVLDVGGSAFNWQFVAIRPRVTLLNREFNASMTTNEPTFEAVIGDALWLPYEAEEFEIAFSNSVIEHVGGLDEQRQFAAEIRRVAARVWVQTPARAFFIEPHFLMPFVHWLPRSWRAPLVRWFSPWRWLSRASRAEVEQAVREIRLLSRAEMQELFPDCQIITERFLLWPKSYIAVRP